MVPQWRYHRAFGTPPAKNRTLYGPATPSLSFFYTDYNVLLSSNPSITNDCSVYVSLHNPRTVSYRSRLHWSSVEWRRRRLLRWRTPLKLCRMKTKTIAALKKKKKKRRREKKKREEEEKKKKRGNEGKQHRPYFCAVLPQVCETRNPRPQRSGIPHASPSPIQGSGLFCNNVWVFDWIHSRLKLFFLKIRRIEIWFVFCFICSSLCFFPNWKKYFNFFLIGKNILMFS